MGNAIGRIGQGRPVCCGQAGHNRRGLAAPDRNARAANHLAPTSRVRDSIVVSSAGLRARGTRITAPVASSRWCQRRFPMQKGGCDTNLVFRFLMV